MLQLVLVWVKTVLQQMKRPAVRKQSFTTKTFFSSAVFQIQVNSISQPALLYENVVVSDGNPILRDLLFSPDHQFLYALTDKQVGQKQDKSMLAYSSIRFFSVFYPPQPVKSGRWRWSITTYVTQMHTHMFFLMSCMFAGLIWAFSFQRCR